MSITLLFLLLFALLVYWLFTQILPERRKVSILRPTLGDGLLDNLNERRHQQGLPLLELDPDLTAVAEEKAVHQVTTGISEEGWDYPHGYTDMFGQSLLMEMLVTGPMETMLDRLYRQRDLLDGEWVRCGIGVAGQQPGEVVIALILCRQAWEPLAEVNRRALADRFVLD